MKRANGTGTIVKLKGNRRKPWTARVTIGYKENGQSIQKTICNEKGEKYFEERTEAEEALLWWNKNKNNLNVNKLDYTFKQLFDEWSEIYIPNIEERKLMRETHQTIKGKLGLSNSMGLLAAVKKFESLYNKRYSSIRKNDFQQIIYSTKGKKTKLVDMRNLIMKLDNYAIGEDIINKGYGSLLDIEYEASSTQRTPYTYEMIEKIWGYEGDLIADIQLILLYSGMRIEELLIIENKNIHLNDDYLVGGLKTDAGKNRIIPIHHEIRHIIQKYYDEKNKYLFAIDNNKRISYEKYRLMYLEFMSKLNLNENCTTHETRYTFRSEFDRLINDGIVNKVCVNKIIGHKSGEVGEDVYTQKTIEELKDTIEKLDYRKNKDKKVTYLRVINSH